MSNTAARLSIALPEIASLIDDELMLRSGRRCAFVLVIEADQVAQYISNTDRQDGAEMIESLLARWKANRADIPAHYNPDLKGGGNGAPD